MATTKSREKRKLVTEVITKTKAEEYFATYAGKNAKIAQLEAKRETELVKIREKYQEEIKLLESEREEAAIKLQHYAESNREDLFSKKKSMEMQHGVIGFRTSTPSLKTLEKKITWAVVLDRCKRLLPDYIRTKEEVDKEALINDRDSIQKVEVEENGQKKIVEYTLNSKFQELGVFIDQPEIFFIEPKKEEAVAV